MITILFLAEVLVNRLVSQNPIKPIATTDYSSFAMTTHKEKVPVIAYGNLHY